MKVFLVDNMGNPPRKLLLDGCGFEAEMEDYTNKVTGRNDPVITFAPSRFIHLSTLKQTGLRLQNEVGEIIG